jgi:isopropylmalate/homocitrate/citramalate synthase
MIRWLLNRSEVAVIQRREDSVAAANVLTTDYDDGIKHAVYLEDDTLRDGEQTVGVCLSLEQKVEIAKRLLDAGMHRMIIGFPAVSEEERKAARAVLALGYEDRMLSCLSRAIPSDVDHVIACGFKNVGLFVPISDLHLKYKLQCDEDTALERTAKAVRYARDKGLTAGVGFEDASRAPLSRIIKFAKAMIDAGACSIAFADTVGIMTPLTTYKVIKQLTTAMGDIPLTVHFHNDLGMSVANALTAVQAGAVTISGSFAGLGERAGNTCLEEIATILRVKYGMDMGIDLAKLVAAARRIAEIAQMPVSPCKPILGSKVYSHESGIHVHGITSEPATYEAFPPELIGREHEIRFGKHSGLHSIRYLAQKHGISASDVAMEQTLARIKAQTVEHGCPSPDEAVAILRGFASP